MLHSKWKFILQIWYTGRLVDTWVGLTHNDSSEIKCRIQVWPFRFTVSSTFDILKENQSAGDQPKKANFNYLLIHLTWISFELIKYEPHRHGYFFGFPALNRCVATNISMYLWKYPDIVWNDNLPTRNHSTVWKQIRQFFIGRKAKQTSFEMAWRTNRHYNVQKLTQRVRDKDDKKLMRNGNVTVCF